MSVFAYHKEAAVAWKAALEPSDNGALMGALAVIIEICDRGMVLEHDRAQLQAENAELKERIKAADEAIKGLLKEVKDE